MVGAFRLLFSSNNGTKGLAAARQKQLELFYFSAAPSHSHFANEQNNGNCGKICRPIMNHDGCDMWQKYGRGPTFVDIVKYTLNKYTSHHRGE